MHLTAGDTVSMVVSDTFASPRIVSGGVLHVATSELEVSRSSFSSRFKSALAWRPSYSPEPSRLPAEQDAVAAEPHEPPSSGRYRVRSF